MKREGERRMEKGEGEASVPQRNTKGVKKGRVASDRSFSGAEHPLVACDLPSIGSQPLRARSKDHGAILTLPLPPTNPRYLSLARRIRARNNAPISNFISLPTKLPLFENEFLLLLFSLPTIMLIEKKKKRLTLLRYFHILLRRNNFDNTNYFNVTTCCTPNETFFALITLNFSFCCQQMKFRLIKW